MPSTVFQMALCCHVAPETIAPVVINRLPVGPYRISIPSTYLFAFPNPESSVPIDVKVVLPSGRFRAGATIVIANLSAPAYDISLIIDYAFSAVPGYPLTIRGYQQQTFWWIPSVGWMYAGGTSTLSAIAPPPSDTPVSSVFDPNTHPSYIQIFANAATLQPYFNMYVTSVVGYDGIDGTMTFTGSPGPFTIIGPGDKNAYPSGTLPNNFINCACPEGQTITLDSNGVDVVNGTVTITVQVDNGAWKLPATSAGVTTTSDTTVLTFSGCKVQTSTVIDSLYFNGLKIYLPDYPDNSTYTPFQDNVTGIWYSWYYSNYNTGWIAPGGAQSLIVTNSTTFQGTITQIESTVNGSTYTATVNYSGINVGDISYAYNGTQLALSAPPITPPYPYPGGYKPHVILQSASPFTPIGPSSYNPIYGQGALFNGYFTLSTLIPLPVNLGGNIVFVLDTGTPYTRLAAKVTQWGQTVPATNQQTIYFEITGSAV